MSRPLTELITIAKQNNLDGTEILSRFSLLDLATIYNGIGPDRFPDWLREIVTEANGLFEPAALIHDVEYHIGGTKENFTAANDRFRENCYTLVKAAYSWYDPRRYKWLFRAWRYAVYCQEFGWSGFHKIGEKCECTACQNSANRERTRTDKDSTQTDTDSAGTEAETQEAGSAEVEAEKCAGCEKCTCGKHEPEAEPAAKPKTKKKPRKGKKK